MAHDTTHHKKPPRLPYNAAVICRLLANGYTTKEIAALLFKSQAAIENALMTIRAHYAAKNIAHLVGIVVSLQLVNVDNLHLHNPEKINIKP